jgi:alpha-D-ribose 1-methylphosphonate 5-triphosphate synthase subunit PhnI
MGFVQHLKLPHYVDFQAELELVRRLRAEHAQAVAAQAQAPAPAAAADTAVAAVPINGSATGAMAQQQAAE